MLHRDSMLRTLSVMLLTLSPMQALAAEDWSPQVQSHSAAPEVHGRSATPLLIAALGGLVVGAAIANKVSNDRARAAHEAARWQDATIITTHAEPQTCAPVVACEAPAQAPVCSVPVVSSPARFGYYDLSSQRWFDTIEDCRLEVEAAQQPALVRVIERSTGKNIGTICWVDGEWSVVGSEELSGANAIGYERAGHFRRGAQLENRRMLRNDRLGQRGFRARQARESLRERPYWVNGQQ